MLSCFCVAYAKHRVTEHSLPSSSRYLCPKHAAPYLARVAEEDHSQDFVRLHHISVQHAVGRDNGADRGWLLLCSTNGKALAAFWLSSSRFPERCSVATSFNHVMSGSGYVQVPESESHRAVFRQCLDVPPEYLRPQPAVLKLCILKILLLGTDYRLESVTQKINRRFRSSRFGTRSC